MSAHKVERGTLLRGLLHLRVVHYAELRSDRDLILATGIGDTTEEATAALRDAVEAMQRDQLKAQIGRAHV